MAVSVARQSTWASVNLCTGDRLLRLARDHAPVEVRVVLRRELQYDLASLAGRQRLDLARTVRAGAEVARVRGEMGRRPGCDLVLDAPVDAGQEQLAELA